MDNCNSFDIRVLGTSNGTNHSGGFLFVAGRRVRLWWCYICRDSYFNFNTNILMEKLKMSLMVVYLLALGAGLTYLTIEYAKFLGSFNV